MAGGPFLSEAFAKITAVADPAQFREAEANATKALTDPNVYVRLGTDEAKAQAAKLREQLKAMFDKVGGTVKLDTAEAQLAFGRLSASADRLQKKLSSEKISLDGVTRARLDLLSLQAQADKLSNRFGGQGGGLLRRMLFGATQGLESLGSAGSAFINPITIALGGLAAVMAGPLIAALLPITLGFGTLAVVGAVVFKNLSAGLTTLSAATSKYAAASKQLNTAIHSSPADMKAYQATIHGLEPDLQRAAKLLTDQRVTWQSLTPAQQKSVIALYNNSSAYKALLPDQKNALTALLGEKTAWDNLSPAQQKMSGQLSALGKQFSALQTAVQPEIIQIFGQALRIMKDLLPALKPLLEAAAKAAAKFLGSIAGWLESASGKKFLKWLEITGPRDIKIFGQVLWVTAQVIGRIFSFLNNAGNTWWKNFSFTLGLVRAAALNLRNWFWNDFVLKLISFFGTLGTRTASIWNTIWRNTVTRAQNGVADVIHWVGTLPGRTVSALSGWGHSLASFASSAFNEMWNAIKNVGGDIWNWLTGWVKALPGWLRKLLGIASPSSVFYDIGKNLMLGLEHGIKDHSWKAANVAKSTAAGITGAFSGPAVAIAKQMLGQMGWGSQFGAFNSLEMSEAGWNPRIVNASSGALGIAQALGHGVPGGGGSLGNQYGGYGLGLAQDRAANSGSAAEQLRWMMNYIAITYGSPDAAWAHEQAFHWYAAGTRGAAPGWAWVGERGPELIRMAGGETVVPNAALAGYAKGTGTPLNTKIDHVLRYIRTHPGEPVRYTHLEEQLYLLWAKGHQAARRRLERELHPLIGTRGWVREVIGGITSRDKHHHYRHGDDRLIRHMTAWLNKLEPNLPGRAALARQTARVDPAIAGALAALAGAHGGSAGVNPGGPIIMDQGGWVMPGMNHIWNGTGVPERVRPPGGGPQKIQFEFSGRRPPGQLERALWDWIVGNVRIKGAGNAQLALGSAF